MIRLDVIKEIKTYNSY